MSYILDALKRAERERSSTVAEAAAAGTPPAPRTLRPTTIALAGATLFLAGIGAATLLLRPPAPAPAAIEIPAAAPRQTAAPTPAATAPPLLPDVAALESYESLDDVAPVFQGSAPAPALVAPTTQTGSQPAAAASPSPDAIVASGSPQPTSPPATAAAHPLPPRLAEMPADFQSRFPAPVIQVHVFDTDPSRRWVMVNNRRHGEGGALDSGLRVVEILADGLVLEFSGSRVFWPLNR